MLLRVMHVSFSLVLSHCWLRSVASFSIGPFTVGSSTALPRQTCFETALHGTASEYQPLDGEKRINLKVDLDNSKVVTNQEIGDGEKKVYCRCWLSGQFPLCDGAHLKHNEATKDNVGPLVVSVPKTSKSKTKSLSPVETGRQLRVLWGYRATAILYLLTATLGFNPRMLRIEWASGFLLAAGFAYILASAAKANRLSSDTYKRLNLSLLQFGILDIMGLAFVSWNSATWAVNVFAIPSLLAVIQGIKGYGYGVLGLDKSANTSIVKDFRQGVLSTVKSSASASKNYKALVYMSGIFMITAKKFSVLAKLVHVISRDTNAVAIMPSFLATYARYAVLWTVLYTLRDAADRGRLDGTTFIELNFLAAGALAIMSGATGILSPISGMTFVLSLFSAFTGFSSIRNKKRSKSP